MSKKVVLDSNDLPIAFYETDIHSVKQIPKEAIDIKEEDYIKLSNNSSYRKWNTELSTVENVDLPNELSNYISSNIETLNKLCEIQRLKYITPGSGQALTYQEKSEEATDFLAAGSPADLTPYPFIQAEINATHKDSDVAAKDILTAQSLWITKGALIEQYRLTAKIDINSSLSISEVDVALNSATVNLNGV